MDEKTPTPLPEQIERQERVDRLWRRLTPHVIGFGKAAVPAVLMFFASVLHHSSETAETEQKVRTSYATLAPATNDHAHEIEALKKSVSALSDSVQVLQALVLANRPGFSTKGEALSPTAPVVAKKRGHLLPLPDPSLVARLKATEKVQKVAADRIKADQAPPAKVPTTLPPEPPKNPEPQRPPVPDLSVGGGRGST